jgi:alkylated DNA nucleotide flippase Atl1
VSESRELEVLERVRAIPEGCVSTYGDVSPGAPRFAGAVLFECDEPDLPWWRVVRADGALAKGGRQKRRLVAEGVPFRGERVDMRSARLPS